MSPHGGSLSPEHTAVHQSVDAGHTVCRCSSLWMVLRSLCCAECGTFLYLGLVLVVPSEAQQLFVLPRHKVNGGVLQQRREDEQKTHGHPDVDGLHIGDL